MHEANTGLLDIVVDNSVSHLTLLARMYRSFLLFFASYIARILKVLPLIILIYM